MGFIVLFTFMILPKKTRGKTVAARDLEVESERFGVERC